ncbi:hypothetical protein M422DRAFT_233390 [Sphaerobolus stellatus SS14]|uniref:Voltage-gated hydrogen channel 1 n=1 Tax=Sphaerobolus stellatus (strain SS14) TaxID=990650 RepID=A0A0C9VBI9_SPHS4|nr:hypothetical protein M422DRAFT_233390 [Sphaerobolus stellatus SS14]
MSEQEPLLGTANDVQEGLDSSWSTRMETWRSKAASKLKAKVTHRLIVSLIVVDSILILIDLSYALLSEGCKETTDHPPRWLNVLSHISLAISCVFLLELVVFVWAFGPMYYFGSVLHFCDGAIIVATFILEVVFRGRERELAELLIIFRLVRFAGETAVGVGELDEETKVQLEDTQKELEEKKEALRLAHEEIRSLQMRLSEMGVAPT